MGEIVLAAKITHVPSMFISEREGPHHGCRAPAIAGLEEIARRARTRGADTFVVLDTHWLVNSGFHVNANPTHRGRYTSNESRTSSARSTSITAEHPNSAGRSPTPRPRPAYTRALTTTSPRSGSSTRPWYR